MTNCERFGIFHEKVAQFNYFHSEESANLRY